MIIPRRTAASALTAPALTISLHAATRVAQHHGVDIDEPALAACASLRSRYERALLRLVQRSTYVVQTVDGSGVLTNPTRTRAIVVMRGVVVTVIASSSECGFGARALERMATRLTAGTGSEGLGTNSLATVSRSVRRRGLLL